MREAVLWAVIILALVTAWCRPVWGESPQMVMRVALSFALPFEFLLVQDAYVFPLMSAEPANGGKEAWRGLEVAGNQPYISLIPSKAPFRIRAGNASGEIVLCCPSGDEISFLDGLCILPGDHASAAFQIGKRRYPGGLEISYGISKSGSRKLIAINLVDLEAYTQGVLAGEVYPSWSPEALKAQAVAARTYALRRMRESKSRDYDVDDTVLSQVYLGENGVEAFRNAVLETRGEVLVYEGVPIRAHYFSSGGGTTEGDEEVWLGGNDEPYLTARQDFDWMSPHYSWKEPFAIESRDLFGKLGLKPDCTGWIEPSIWSGDKILAYRFCSGGRTINLTREQIRQKLGLQSPRFHITVRGSEGRETTVKSRTELDASTIVIFDGVGQGHGVGLSQWGAQGMALMCTSAGTPIYNYVDILNHYYPGAELVDNYNIPKGLIELAADEPAAPSYQGSQEPVQHAEEDHTETTYEDDHEDDTEVIEDDDRERMCDEHPEFVKEDLAEPVCDEHTPPVYEDDKKHIKPDYGDYVEFLLE
jgi:stage II sporulation protein D